MALKPDLTTSTSKVRSGVDINTPINIEYPKVELDFDAISKNSEFITRPKAGESYEFKNLTGLEVHDLAEE